MTPTRKCHFCPTEEARAIGGNHWTGTEYIRVDVCHPCYSEGRLASAPRRPRTRRTQPTYAATDWNMLVAFSRKGTNS